MFIFGCRKDANTLAQILSKESFAGILVTDDAAVYQGFSKSQKCWAHLIREAIRFTLLRPYNEEYRTFLNGLLDVYRVAKRASADQRLKKVSRAARVSELVDAVSAFCVSRWGRLDQRSLINLRWSARCKFGSDSPRKQGDPAALLSQIPKSGSEVEKVDLKRPSRTVL